MADSYLDAKRQRDAMDDYRRAQDAAAKEKAEPVAEENPNSVLNVLKRSFMPTTPRANAQGYADKGETRKRQK